MNPIPQILDDLRAGRLIVLIDDENRENEGDLVCAAQSATPANINFMLHQGRGMLCVPLAGELCDKMQLEPQSRVNTSQRTTAYTVTVDAHERFGVTTGVSAADRAATIKVLIDPAAKPSDLARPGHVQPLHARTGGTLVRAGQTEGSVDLCRLAGLAPAAVIIEIMNDDGSMARLDDLRKFCAKHNLKICSVADVIHHRLQREKLVERIDQLTIQTPAGPFNLIAYRSRVDPLPHVALVTGDLGRLDPQGSPIEIDTPVLVRMHSQNLLGDVFADASQPTGSTLHAAMKMIRHAGRGAVVYLRHEGMGSGLLKQLQTLHRSPDQTSEQPDRLPVSWNQAAPGNAPPTDKLDYGIGSQILRDLGIRKLRLLTNHPFHPTALAGFGLSIDQFVPIENRP